MPSLGHTMETGTVTEWRKTVGDPVAAGEVIALLETDKSSFDLEAPGAGVVLAIHVDEGAEVPVGTLLALIGAPGETVADAPEAAPVPTPPEAAPVPKARGPVQPVSRRVAPSPPQALPSGRRMTATPAARALADALGLDLAGIAATGPEGLVSRADVEAAVTGPRPLSAKRRAIAEATGRAWREIPHVPLTGHADLPPGLASSSVLTAAIVRATGMALRRYPTLNGWLSQAGFEPAIVADIGLAVSTGDGLMSVTIRAADRKRIDAIADEIADLAHRARHGALRVPETTGASFTVSTLGRWGVDSFAPVIAAPQVATLGIGQVRRAPREAPDGLRWTDELALTLVFDHRANDGVAAANMLAAICETLENPERMGVPE